MFKKPLKTASSSRQDFNSLVVNVMNVCDLCWSHRAKQSSPAIL